MPLAGAERIQASSACRISEFMDRPWFLARAVTWECIFLGIRRCVATPIRVPRSSSLPSFIPHIVPPLAHQGLPLCAVRAVTLPRRNWEVRIARSRLS